jgi:hypothetical protein
MRNLPSCWESAARTRKLFVFRRKFVETEGKKLLTKCEPVIGRCSDLKDVNWSYREKGWKLNTVS